MRDYNYFTFGEKNGYGQPQLSQEIQGQVKMAINYVTETISDNAIYSDAQFTGLTFDNSIDSSYVIEYEDMRLKVLHVNKAGRFNQVFMKKM